MKNHSYLAFNYILIFLILTNLSFGLFGIYKSEGLTKIHIFAAPIIAAFFIYFLLKQKEWIYQFIIGLNIISLIVNIAGFGLLYLMTIDTLAKFLMIGISYYLLTEINPKRYKKIGII